MTQAQRSITATPAGRLRGYGTGFALSIVLTAIPFGLVMSGALPRAATLAGILAAAVTQILVHLHYFLHLFVAEDRSPSPRLNLATFLLAVLTMTIFVGGTLWIMYNLHYRMMG